MIQRAKLNSKTNKWKPVLVGCIQYNGENMFEIEKCIGSYIMYEKVYTTGWKKLYVQFTKYSQMEYEVKIGDWIIEPNPGENNSHFMVLSKKEFEETYTIIE